MQIIALINNILKWWKTISKCAKLWTS